MPLVLLDGGRLVERAPVRVHEPGGLHALRDEGRFPLHQVGTAAHELGLEPERAHAVRDHEQRLEHLVDDTARHRVVVPRGRLDDAPEATRQLRRERREPRGVVGGVVHEADGILQRAGVAERGQQPLGQPPRELGEEAGVGQNAAVGEEVDLLALREEIEEARPDRGAVRRIGLDGLQDERVVCVAVRAPARPDRVEEPREAIGRFDLRIEEAPQRGVDRQALGKIVHGGSGAGGARF